MTETANVNISVTAVNDAAVITPVVVNLTETNAILSTGGTLTITDIDSPAIFVAQASTVGTYGTFTLTTAGVWTYTTSTAHNEFSAGVTYTDVLTVTSADGTTSTITVNIAGTNDGPVAIGTNNTALEDAAFVAVVIQGTDVDGIIASFNLSSLPTNGALYTDAALTILAVTGVDYAATGNALTLFFVPQPDFNSDTFTGGVVPSFNFTATDNDGLVSTSATETITITDVSDGAPIARADNFQTLLGTPIIITAAQLLGNDTLLDHARITGITALNGSGTLVDNLNGTYTYTPAVAGTRTFTYTITDDDGQTSPGTVTLTTFNTRDDIATVQESALLNGTGGGLSVVTGNLFTNDAGLTGNITALTNAGGTAVLAGGVFTLATPTGTLVVNQTTGAYTYTLNDNVDNDGAAPAGVTNLNTVDALQTFTYTRTGGTANLNVTIQDDRPVADNTVTEVSVRPLPAFNLFFMIDVSGSQSISANGGDQRLIDAAGNATVTAAVNPAGLRFDSPNLGTSTIAQIYNALVALVSRYFDESTNVSVEFGTFSTGANFDNIAYTTKASALAALAALINTTGATNYSAGLTALQQQIGAVANPNDGVQRVAYFITDGTPSGTGTSGTINGAGAAITSDPTNPAVSTGYQAFIQTNNIQSFALAVGPAVPNTAPLIAIHNIDADGSDITAGAVNNGRDLPLIVSEISTLQQTLLATVPESFTGNIGGAGSGAAAVRIGVDGGFTQYIDLLLDGADAGTVPDTLVRFTYNPVTGQITNNNNAIAGATVTGDSLTLNAANGFSNGNLTFNFNTGNYVFVPQGTAVAGDRLVIGFRVIDNDGDFADATNTIVIVDGKPIAVNDFDTLLPSAAAANTKFFEGNVTNAVGTDGGGTQLTGFTTGASGEDNIVDGASVTSIVFRGVTYNLTAASTGTASGGNFTITANGELTWTSIAEPANVLVFHSDGYYRYTPPAAQTATPPQTAVPTFNFAGSSLAAANAAGLILEGYDRTANLNNAGNATVVFNGNGLGVDSTGGADDAARLDNLENLSIRFNRANFPQGVQNVTINVNAASSDLSQGAGGISATLQYSIFDIGGNLIGQFASINENAIVLGPQFSNIGRILIQPNSANNGAQIARANIQSITYNTVNVAATANTPDEVIQYTLTDRDVVNPDSSSASLTLHVVTNEYAGTVNGDVLSGSASNDLISGLAGNDTLNGLAGSDIIRGGLGNDTIDGGADNDQLFGGEGNDSILGGLGNDLIRGDAGNDTLLGGDGNDSIEGGIGADSIVGGIGADTIVGGAGNDTLTGGTGAPGIDTTGSDTFKWELADRGVIGTPANDTITDFNAASAALGGDVLDLRDLLTGENQSGGIVGNLASFLHFEKVGADTILHISDNGSFAAGFNAARDVQIITLTNVDLVTGFANDQQIIQNLLTNQKLITD